MTFYQKTIEVGLYKFVCVCVLLLQSACASNSLFPVKPDVRVQSINLGKLSISEQELVFNLAIDNQNNFSIPISGSQFTASFGGQQLAKAATQETLVLGANGVTIMPLKVKSQLIKTFADLGRAIANGTINLDYEIAGQLDVELSVFPVGIPFNLKGNIARDVRKAIK